MIKKVALITITFFLGGYCLVYPTYLASQEAPSIPYHLPEIERFFAKQPKDIKVASLEGIPGNNIPTFSQRSTLIGPEFFLPYHPKYYIPMKEKY